VEPISALISTLVSTLQAAATIAKRIRNKELQEKLDQVYELVSHLRHQLFNLEDENRALQQQIKELKSTKEIESQLNIDGEVYYRSVDGVSSGPYCPLCWDDKKVLIRTQVANDGRHICNLHNKSFANPGKQTSLIAFVGKPAWWDEKF